MLSIHRQACYWASSLLSVLLFQILTYYVQIDALDTTTAHYILISTVIFAAIIREFAAYWYYDAIVYHAFRGSMLVALGYAAQTCEGIWYQDMQGDGYEMARQRLLHTMMGVLLLAELDYWTHRVMDPHDREAHNRLYMMKALNFLPALPCRRDSRWATVIGSRTQGQSRWVRYGLQELTEDALRFLLANMIMCGMAGLCFEHWRMGFRPMTFRTMSGKQMGFEGSWNFIFEVVMFAPLRALAESVTVIVLDGIADFISAWKSRGISEIFMSRAVKSKVLRLREGVAY